MLDECRMESAMAGQCPAIFVAACRDEITGHRTPFSTGIVA